MKKLTLITLILSAGFLHAQPPAGYYDPATGTGYELKTQLYSIIKDHNYQEYISLRTLYTHSAFLDNYYENNQTLLDIYSERPNGQDAYEYTASPIGGDNCGNYTAEGDCYNREHLVPQSSFGSSYPMYSDAFHVWPTDGFVNNRRDNYAFGRVNNATWTSTNGSKLGFNLNQGYSSGYSATVFEPIDEFKGDIARCLLYFATRYESEGIASWNFPMFNNTNSQVFTDTFKNILLYWHASDPVSPREIAINNAVYEFQGNRNPYIDNPQWVHDIWGPAMEIKNEDYQPADYVKIYPTLSKDGKVFVETTSFNAETKQILIFNLNGLLIQKVENKSGLQKIQLNIPVKGTYILKVLGNDFEVNRKIIVQ